MNLGNLINKIILISLIIGVTMSSNLHAGNSIRVYDATLYGHKNNAGFYGIKNAIDYGIERIEVVYAVGIWMNQQHLNDEPPTSELFNHSVNIIRSRKDFSSIKLICLDIEHWPTDEENLNLLSKNINKYIDTYNLYKTEFEHHAIGFYGMLPLRNYYAAISRDTSKKMLDWREKNSKLMSLAKHVDIIYPSLYTFTSDQNDWVKYAINTITEAKKYGKPVYPFIWPQYHDSVRLRRLDYISDEFWMLQLKTIAQYADGVVIWGGWDLDKNMRMTWNEDQEWWIVLKNYLALQND